MTIIFVLLIALAWVGWLGAWARDRYSGGGVGFDPNSLVATDGPLGMPRTRAASRRRRRDISIVLAVLSVLAFVGSRAVAILSPISLLFVVAFVVYAIAAARVEMSSTQAAGVSRGLPAQRRANFEIITN